MWSVHCVAHRRASGFPFLRLPINCTPHIQCESVVHWIHLYHVAIHFDLDFDSQFENHKSFLSPKHSFQLYSQILECPISNIFSNRMLQPLQPSRKQAGKFWNEILFIGCALVPYIFNSRYHKRELCEVIIYIWTWVECLRTEEREAGGENCRPSLFERKGIASSIDQSPHSDQQLICVYGLVLVFCGFFCFASGTLNSYEPKIHSHQRGTAQNLGLYMHACTTYITYTYSIYTERNGHKGLLPQWGLFWKGYSWRILWPVLWQNPAQDIIEFIILVN